MLFLEIILLAVGLSMDSLAVSVTGGAVIRNCTVSHIIRIATVMGIFQAGFTVIGYLAGMGFQKYICAFDHWIAFFLLLYLGGKMILDSHKEDGDDSKINILCNKTLYGLAAATSIDALAIGISLAFLEEPLPKLALTIGIVTFIFSATGVYFGSQFEKKINLQLDLIGGIILIAIGTKILIEHLFFN